MTGTCRAPPVQHAGQHFNQQWNQKGTSKGIRGVESVLDNSCAKTLVTGNFLVFKRLVMILLKGKYNECFQKKNLKSIHSFSISLLIIQLTHFLHKTEFALIVSHHYLSCASF